MELNNYKLLKIPFVSKKKLAEIFGKNLRNAKYSFSGTAYYLIDLEKKCIVWERAFFEEAEYRPTDNAMLITRHYENNYFKKNIDRKDILNFSKINYLTKKASKQQLDKINQHILNNVNTVLNAEGVISGANPSGSDSNVKNSPLLIDPRKEKKYIRFQNAIKKVRCKNSLLEKALKKVLIKANDIEKIFTKQITIEEFCSLNETFGKWMQIHNSDILELLDANESIKEYINEIDQNYLKKSVEHFLFMYEKKLIKEDKLISKLRSEFRIALLKEATEKGFKEYTGSKEISLLDCEAAHILGVKEIKENELNYKWIANPNNGLLLTPNIHTLLDKKKITLNSNGEFIYTDDNYKNIEFKSINKKILNSERVMFINKRNEFLKLV